jgi:hypothetical protein
MAVDADTIAKLLRKAEKASTPEEAELFFAKAQDLMTKYAIDAMTVHAKMNDGDKDPLGPLCKRRVMVGSSYALADASLMHVIGRANDVKVLYGRYEKTVYLYGYETDCLNVELLYTSLLLVVARQALDYGRKSGLKNMPLFIARRSFREAFAQRIGQRLESARKEAFKAYEDMGGNPLLPMVQSKKDAVEAFSDPAGKRKQAKHSYDPHAGAAGREAANRADLGGPRLGGKVSGAIG